MRASRRVADRFAGRGLARRPSVPRGSFESARRLLLLLALASLVVILEDLLRQEPPALLVGSAGFVVLVIVWVALYRRIVPTYVADVVDAASFLLLGLAVPMTWATPGAMLGSLWFRSLGASKTSMATRVALYTLVRVLADAIHVGALTWHAAMPALSAVPLWAVTAAVARHLGLMLVEHDRMAAIGAMESELSAAMVEESDDATLTAWSRSSWRALCHIVPGLRIAQLEERREVLAVVTTAGPWTTPPTSLTAESIADVAPCENVDAGVAGTVPALDEAAGATCRWSTVPLLHSAGRYTLLVGIPSGMGASLVAAVTGALARSELVLQHARDHLAISARARADDLTGLPNRLAFFETLSALEHLEQGLSVIFLDLDGFKEINDTHGHAVGDEVLRQAAARLNGVCAEAAVCARLGGDEFAVLFAGADAQGADAVARRAEAAVTAPMRIAAGTVAVGVSWGVASVEDGDTTELLARADAAMYTTKKSRRTSVRLV